MQQNNTSLEITSWTLFVICIHHLECVSAYIKTLERKLKNEVTKTGN